MSGKNSYVQGPRLRGFGLVLAALGSCVVLFICAPLVALVLSSSWPELRAALSDGEVTASIWRTLGAGLAATSAATVTGVPLAYLLARKQFVGKSLFLAIVDLPIVIPHSAAGIALLALVGRRSLAGSILGSLLGTFGGIAVAMAFVSVPFLVGAARMGFLAVPERLEKAARTLGASPARVFFTISVPLAWRDILSGMILMWARGISEFGAVVIIAYHPMTTPVLIFQRFNDFGLAHARAAGVLLIAICVTAFAALRCLAVSRAVEAGDDA